MKFCGIELAINVAASLAAETYMCHRYMASTLRSLSDSWRVTTSELETTPAGTAAHEAVDLSACRKNPLSQGG